MTPLAPVRAFPNTHARALYRVGVWCEMCHVPRVFRYDTGHWVCTECQFVKMRDGVPDRVWVWKEERHGQQ